MTDIKRMMRGVAHDLWRVPLPEKQQPAQESVPAPAFEAIWKAVDEGIDWTGLLAEPAGQPALATLANDVLLGNADAYRTALDILKPLADLGAYYTDCAVEIVDADTLSASYTAAFAADDKKHACGLALRTARDLLAALPVSSVRVHAAHTDGAVLEAQFTRDALRHIRVNVADPVEIAAQCGKWL